MSKFSRTILIEEFKALHDTYLETISDYIPPESRKELVDESIEKFNKYMADAESGELSDDALRKAIAALKDANESTKSERGLCSPECMKALLRAQSLCVGRTLSMKHKLPEPAISGLIEMVCQMTTDAIVAVIALNTKDEKPWKVRGECHDMLHAATEGMESIAQAIEAGRVMTLKIPKADSTKYKQFLN